MKYKLFSTDIDDTLLAHDGSLSEANREILGRMHHAGIKVVLTSGRATISMRPIAEKIMDASEDDYLICFNGARVVTLHSDDPVYQAPVSTADITAIMEYCREHGIHAQGYDDTDFIMEEGCHREDYTDLYVKTSGMNYRYVADMAAELPTGSPKLLLIGDHDELEKHRHLLHERTGGRLAISFSKPKFLEVVSAGVNKGAALTGLANRLGIDISECLAVGDSLNDIDLIKTAGRGLAVANARDELKAVAAEVLESTCDDSVLVEIARKYFPEI